MDFTSPSERCHRDNGELSVTSDVMKTQTPETRMKLSKASKSNLGKNFSYPRPDGHPPRHESADSRSSVTSNGSIPGMTDASDSEQSVDDDYHYNASASELWDSFWPKGSTIRKPHVPTIIRTSSSRDIFPGDCLTSQPGDDPITLAHAEPEVKESKSPHWLFGSRRPQNTPNPATYSVYPQASISPPRPAPLPPRSSSLSAEASSPNPQPNRRRTLRATKSIAHIKTSKSSINLPVLNSAPPGLSSSSTITPISESKPPLRPSTSAYNIRERSSQYYSSFRTHHNATAPLTPVSTPLPDHVRPPRAQLERQVSVFELDSDNESDTEDSFAKRIARGLHHKKSSSLMKHSRNNSERRAAAPDEEDADNSRKRTGSLGRILGMKGR